VNLVVGAAAAAANLVGAAARVGVTNEAAAVVLGVVLGTEVVVAAPALRFTGVSMRIRVLAAQMLIKGSSSC